MIRYFRNKEIRNAGWIIAERVMQSLLSLIVGVLSARYLGPSNYGALNYTASFVTFFSSIALLGMDGVIIKKMIEQPDREGDFLGGCIVLRLISSSLCCVIIFATVHFLNPDDSIKTILAFLQSFQLIFQSFNILDSWFQRYYKSKYVSIGKTISFCAVSVYKIILLATSKSIEWFAAAHSLSCFIEAILLIAFFKSEKKAKIKINFNAGLAVLKDSYHYILSGLMVSLYSQMDKIMIGKIMTDMDVGLYATATTICGMWIFIPTAIINSFRPTVIELRQTGNIKKYNLRLRQLYSAIIWLCIVVSAVIYILAPFFIKTLYGSEYLGAINPLRIAIWLETFSMIGTLRSVWILAENKNKYVKYHLAIGVIVNFILNSVMIPTYGVEGAAIATLVTQITTSIISPMFFKETRIHTKIVWEAFCLKWYFHEKRKNKDA